MIKQRTITLCKHSKLFFFSKCLVILGIILLMISIILYVFSLYVQPANVILAFAILLLFGGGILYFFHCQFMKLIQITEDLENEDEHQVPSHKS